MYVGILALPVLAMLVHQGTADAGFYGNRCLTDDLEERKAIADMVFSGRVMSLHPNQYNGTYYCTVSIFRVMKGHDLLTSVLDLPEDTEVHYKRLVDINGFGNERICDSDVTKGDTRVFLVSYNRETNLTLNSSLARIRIASLRRTSILSGELIPYSTPMHFI